MSSEQNSISKCQTSEHSELEAVFSNMVEGVIVVDQDKTIININRAAIKLLQIDVDVIIGRPFPSAIQNDNLYRPCPRCF